MMLNDSWPQYLLIRAVILFLRWTGPACFFVTGWHIVQSWPQWTFSWLQIWPAAEAIWFVFFIWYRRHLQRPATHPTLWTYEERRALFNRVRAEVHDPDRFLSGWFRGAPAETIGRDELKRFLDWAFWDGRAGEKDASELEEYASKVEKMMRHEFAPGLGTARSLRLTLDPITMECRTILWYFLMGVVDFATHMQMRRRFQYYKTTATSLWILPIRPATWFEQRRSPAPSLSYWLRPHTSKARLPILYIHGIGIGLLPNVKFLSELQDALSTPNDGTVGILALEIPQVSSRITGAIPTRGEFLSQITAVLAHHNIDRFVLAVHSYGSVPSTHLLQDDALASRIANTLLIDPVTLLLHMPDVAYNFTAREPRSANEWLLWYFASQDPGVAHTLGRHFFWTQNVLWRDRVRELAARGMRITASLARRDLIVDTEAVGAYLMEGNVMLDPVLKSEKERGGRKVMALEQTRVEGSGDGGHWKDRAWRGSGVEVLWWETLDHAQVFDHESSRKELIDVLVEYVRGA